MGHKTFANERVKREYERLRKEGKPFYVERDLLTSVIIRVEPLRLT